MSERQKPHNGRDTAGNFKVRQEDYNDKLADPKGADYVADDVRLGGAVVAGLNQEAAARTFGGRVRQRQRLGDREAAAGLIAVERAAAFVRIGLGRVALDGGARVGREHDVRDRHSLPIWRSER